MKTYLETIDQPEKFEMPHVCVTLFTQRYQISFNIEVYIIQNYTVHCLYTINKSSPIKISSRDFTVIRQEKKRN